MLRFGATSLKDLTNLNLYNVLVQSFYSVWANINISNTFPFPSYHTCTFHSFLSKQITLHPQNFHMIFLEQTFLPLVTVKVSFLLNTTYTCRVFFIKVKKDLAKCEG